MGNIVTTLKRFLSNKNTVTILGILIGLGVLYWGYNYQIKKAIQTVSIPVAKEVINPKTTITADLVTTTEVLGSYISSYKNLITQYNQVVNNVQTMCVAYGNTVQPGSFFFTDQIVPCGTIPSNIFVDMPDGYKPVSLSVDIHSTYGNSMYPGDYIDLYVKMDDDTGTGRFMYGKLISSIKIADVRDGSGNSIHLMNNGGTPAELIFQVPESMHLLLAKAIYAGVTIYPVPGNGKYTANPNETRYESEYLKNKILEKTSSIPDEIVLS